VTLELLKTYFLDFYLDNAADLHFPLQYVDHSFCYYVCSTFMEQTCPHFISDISIEINFIVAEFEWLLKEAGAVESKLTEDPKPKVKDVMMSKLRGAINDEDDEVNDW
jgi:hypothetical protein